MPTVITRFVDAAGGFDYTLPSLAVAAFPSNFVTADEQWEVGIYKTAGGYADGFDMPSCTTDATRYPRMYAVSGDEYDRATDTGVYLTATRNFDGVITNLTIPYLRLEGIGFKNSGLSSARAFLSSANNCSYINLYGKTADNYQVFDFTAGNACSASGLLSEDGTISFNFGSFAEYDCNNLTAIDPSSTGYSKTGSSRDTELINCLKIGSGSVWGSGAFAGSTDYNATDDATTPTGANSLANRTTSDLVDYAGNDYRTASGSALATAGDGVLADYIGFALEAGGGAVTATIAVTASKPTVAISSSATLPQPDADIGVSVSKPTVAISGSATLPQPDATISVSVNKPTVSVAGSATLPNPNGDITVTVSKPAVSFSGSATLPNPSASLSAIANKPTVSIAGAATLPQPDASISITTNKPVVSISASATTTQPNANVSIAANKPSVMVSASATLPQPNADVSITANKPVVSMEGSATIPQWDANVAITVNKPTVNIESSSTLPQPDAQISITVSKPVVSISATVSGIDITVSSGATIEIPAESNTVTLPAMNNSITIN